LRLSLTYFCVIGLSFKKRKSKNNSTPRKRKSKKAIIEVVVEPKPKKQKQAKKAPQLIVVEPTLPTIKEEVADLGPVKILDKRTRGGSSEAATFQPKPKIQKKKRNVRKLKVSTYDEQEDVEVEVATDLVTRMERRKKVAAESSEPKPDEHEAFIIEKAIGVASQLEIPTVTLMKETAMEDAKKVVEFAEAVQGLASEKTGKFLKATMEIKREKACSKAGISEAAGIKGNSSTHNIFDNVIDLDSSSPSTNIDDIPLNQVYKTLDKAFTPSPSNQTQKIPDDVDAFESLSIDERIGSLVQRRIDSCKNLPVNHWLQPSFVRPLQTVLPGEKFGGESTQAASDILESTSSQQQPTTNNQLVIHLCLMINLIITKVSYMVITLTQIKPVKHLLMLLFYKINKNHKPLNLLNLNSSQSLHQSKTNQSLIHPYQYQMT